MNSRQGASFLERIDAVIFDVDGVITDTASVHATAWKRLFDSFLRDRAERTGQAFEPFDVDHDYRLYVDGRPRFDGVRSFLASRGIELPEGDPRDPPDRETVCGLGNRKNAMFLDHLRRHGARPYRSTVRLIRELRARGVATAAISASRNMLEVLRAAAVADLFDARVDGIIADELGLPGKPHPAVFEEAARRLHVEPGCAAVVEDALAGVEAGKRGGFGLVVGVDRTGHPDALLAAGADIVVTDLSELDVGSPSARRERRAIEDLPSALDRADEILGLLSGRRPVVCLDYDGTLTPIVERPEDAMLPSATRAVLARLASQVPVAVLSGRDLEDVRRMVGVEAVTYAGSHGFDLMRPDGTSEQHAREYLPELDVAERELRSRIAPIPGARVERKRFAVAVHVRQVAEDRVPEVEAAVVETATAHPRLRRTGGKRVFELLPDVDWDKGRALLRLLESLGLAGPEHLPIYLGDDETDEDAFGAVRDRGLGIVVRGEADDRPTLARYALRDPGETRAFLQTVADAVGGGSGT